MDRARAVAACVLIGAAALVGADAQCVQVDEELLAEYGRCQHGSDQVELKDYSQWALEDGYWIGQYSYYDENGDPVYTPNDWNYRYDHYKGFVVGSVLNGHYSQRNVFLYPPQTSARCASDSTVAFEGDTCGLNGGIKKTQSDQSTEICNLCKPGMLSGHYQGQRSTTELVGNGNALLYQVYLNIDGVETLRHSQLTTLTTLANGSAHRTRTAQLFDSSTMSKGRAGAPYRASYYRETRVTAPHFYLALQDSLAGYNMSTLAMNRICHGGLHNLLSFLEGAKQWPAAAKYVCPPQPVATRVLRWTAAGAGKYPDTFGRTAQEGELVTAADVQAAAGVGAGLTTGQLVIFGWWQDCVLVWTVSGAGQRPDVFGRATEDGELVTHADIDAAGGVALGLLPEQLVSSGWWRIALLTWTADGAGQHPDTFGRVTQAGEAVTFEDTQAAGEVGAGLTPSQLVEYGWWQVISPELPPPPPGLPDPAA